MDTLDYTGLNITRNKGIYVPSSNEYLFKKSKITANTADSLPALCVKISACPKDFWNECTVLTLQDLYQKMKESTKLPCNFYDATRTEKEEGDLKPERALDYALLYQKYANVQVQIAQHLQELDTLVRELGSKDLRRLSCDYGHDIYTDLDFISRLEVPKDWYEYEEKKIYNGYITLHCHEGTPEYDFWIKYVQ